MMATSYVKDNEGNTFIAASQRADGSWRKPRRVKPDFVPQDEVPLYESKGKKIAKSHNNNTGLPPGITPEIWEQMKAQQKSIGKAGGKTSNQQSKTAAENVKNASIGQSGPGSKASISPIGDNNNEDGWVTVNRKKGKNQVQPSSGADSISTGVNGITIDDKKNKKKNNRRKKPNAGGQGDVAISGDEDEVKAVPQAPTVTTTTKPGGQQQPKAIQQQPKSSTGESDSEVDPAKKLRNLKKRLRAIEELKAKVQADPSIRLDKAQQDKIKSEKEVKHAIKALEKITKA